MKSLIILVLLIIKGVFVLSQDMVSPSAKADSILIKVWEKMNTLKNVQYDHIRELNYSSENYHNISKWTVYYDFKTADTTIGFKY
jgi:hypothetical protein